MTVEKSEKLFEKAKYFYFPPEIKGSLGVTGALMRSEPTYDADPAASETALQWIGDFGKCVNIKSYLVAAKNGQKNRIRSHKKILWGQKELLSLPYHQSEVDIDDRVSALIATIDLADYPFPVKHGYILSWAYGVFVFSTLSLPEVHAIAEGWLRQEESIFSFDYEAVAEDLQEMPTTAVMRYFAADNGDDERIIIVGNQEFLDTHFEPCLDLLKPKEPG